MNSEDQYKKEYRRLAAIVHQTIREEFPNYREMIGDWLSSAVNFNSHVTIEIFADQNRFAGWLSSVPQIRLKARYSLGSLKSYSHLWPYTPENLTRILKKAKELLAEEQRQNERSAREHQERIESRALQKSELEGISMPSRLWLVRQSDGTYRVDFHNLPISPTQLKAIVAILNEPQEQGRET